MKAFNFKYLILIAIATIAISCQTEISNQSDIKTASESDSIEKIIYSTFINKALATETKKDESITMDYTRIFEWKEYKQIVIHDSTWCSKRKYNYLVKELKTLSRDTYSDFERKNKKSEKVNKVAINAEIFYISKSYENKLFDKESLEHQWDNFYIQFANAQGISSLSKVGFNKHRDQALMYVDYQSHNLDGRGIYILYKKLNDQWLIESITTVWIS